MNTLKRFWLQASFAAMSMAAGMPQQALAQFGGPIPAIPGTPDGASDQGIRDAVLSVLTFVLNFLALVAVVFIVIAGIRLIVSQGEEEVQDKAKKTILYVIVGLIIVLFARLLCLRLLSR